MTNNEIAAVYYGVSPVDKIYLGDELVWPTTPPDPYLDMPLTFDIISGGTVCWKTNSSSGAKTIQYNLNDGGWTDITSTTGGTTIAVNTNDVIQFRGDNAQYSTIEAENKFSGTTAKFEAKGNIMSLVNSTNFATATTLASAYTFGPLFKNCTGLISAENLRLPATILSNSCYSSMFQGCTSLATAPELPATTLTQKCYEFMFYGCSSLTTAPELPATNLEMYCYQYMFLGCTSLTTAPELPATTLKRACYQSMFESCTGLTSAPELPATTLVQDCYLTMFAGCKYLNYIKCLATDISAETCTTKWLGSSAYYSAPPTGTFVKHPNMNSWTRDVNGIPTGWTVQDATI